MLNKKSKTIKDWQVCIGLLAILVLAAVLRIAGLRWGLPNDLHIYSYHPDEFLTIGSSGRIAGLIDGHRTINPGLYNYPSLYLYISALSMMVANGYGLLNSGADIYLAARIITVLMALGAVGATYWAGREMFGRKAGLLSALIIAIAPIHLQHSHFATVDVPSTLFVALCLGYSAKIIKSGMRRDYILAGIMAGLAAGTKYNAVLLVLAPVAAHLLSGKMAPNSLPIGGRVRERAQTFATNPNLWLIPAFTILAFIISTPGCVLYTGQFLHGLTYEMQHASQGHGLVFAGTGNGFLYTLTSSLHYGLGYGLTLLFVVASIGGICKRDKNAIMMLAFIIPYYALISLSQVRFARYALPMFPAAAILISSLAFSIYARLASIRKLAAYAWLGAIGIILLGTYNYSTNLNYTFLQPDPRDIAARWITQQIPPDTSIGLIDYPWFYTPPLSNKWILNIESQRREAINQTKYKIVVFSDPANSTARPEWIITSNYEIADAIRLRNNKSLSAGDNAEVDKINRDSKIISQYYHQYMEFSAGPFVSLPHDMRYPSPKITVYSLKANGPFYPTLP